MIGVALVDIRHWFRIAYWAYAAGLVLVIAVDMRGFVGMGAQRWIDLGVIQLQPSALMNVAMVLALSRYFHSLSDEDVGRIRYWILPGLMVLVPAALVLKQPDLGTATMLLMGGASLFFIAGMPLRFLLTAAIAAAAALPGSGIFCAIIKRSDLHIPRPGQRPARRRLSYPAVKDRPRLRRIVRQGLPARQPEPS